MKNPWTAIHELFAATPAKKPEPQNVVWHGEVEALRQLRRQRIAIACKQHGEILALPVREMRHE